MGKTLKHILITGASSGLGGALAMHYAQEGRILSLTGRDKARLENIAHICRERGAQVHTATLDITDAIAVEHWLIKRDMETPVDLVIANAGISGGSGEDQETAAQARRIFDVNINGVLNTVFPLESRMTTRGNGHIAIMSSLAGYRGFPGAPAYCASKAAVRVYGESLRGMLSKNGVKVSVICPGFIRTPMTTVNDFPMPFLMEPDRAAQYIAQKLAQNAGRIAFPAPMAFMVWLLMILPDVIVQYLLKSTPTKGKIAP